MLPVQREQEAKTVLPVRRRWQVRIVLQKADSRALTEALRTEDLPESGEMPVTAEIPEQRGEIGHLVKEETDVPHVRIVTVRADVPTAKDARARAELHGLTITEEKEEAATATSASAAAIREAARAREATVVKIHAETTGKHWDPL